MKTASIDVYMPHGSRDWVADVRYRGRILATFDKSTVLCWESMRRGVIAQAKVWAETHGFTHYKLTDAA